jgi:hypothetical protein
MSGLDVIMLADAGGSLSTGAAVFLLLVFVVVPALLAVVGLILSFFPRYKWWALAMAIAGCVLGAVPLLLDSGLCLGLLLPLPFGIITAVQVQHGCWKEKKQPQDP